MGRSLRLGFGSGLRIAQSRFESRAQEFDREGIVRVDFVDQGALFAETPSARAAL
ncbi:hypothetical protein [Streptomyces candidus]|uniref:Uncharacterized protein n=1 Tax=Streptomyces candidus TaxID=67283 RepID=A0A7X0HB49_9ACTN|nr:hypothetical protein [Streptomyces candidus]MBB6434421.1 hypothetical protein [Streptomyces candidus]